MDKHISINKDTKDIPIVLDNLDFNNFTIIIEENSHATIISYLKTGTVKAIIGNNSSVKLVRFSQEELLEIHETWEIGDNSNLSVIDLEFGSSSTKKFEYILSGYNSSLIHKAGIVCNENSKTNLITKQVHTNKCSTSSVIIKSALFDSAKSSYNSLIKIDQNGIGSNAIQSHTALVFSENAQNIAIPALEVNCSQVQCKHGAATGHISDEHLWYLRSKGHTISQASKIILLGFFKDLLYDLKNTDQASLFCEKFYQILATQEI